MKTFKKILLFIFITILVIVSYFIFNGYLLYKEAIDTKSIEDRVSSLQSEDFFTSYDELPEYYIDAVVCVEDHKFFTHSGINFFSTARAIFNNITSFELKECGSSITQQVAKNLCFTQEKKISRKIAELFVVYNLEKNYSKEEIFEMYVNNIYFGNGYYNIHDASMRILPQTTKRFNSL